jgi:hypothetical protein
MMSPVDARRRWFGLLFLLLAGGLLLWGQTWLKPYLHGLVYVVYWLACFVFTGLAMLTALLDARAVRRQARQQQRELAERALDAIRSQSPPQQADSTPPATDQHPPRQA